MANCLNRATEWSEAISAYSDYILYTIAPQCARRCFDPELR
jgi:hypothetical protein